MSAVSHFPREKGSGWKLSLFATSSAIITNRNWQSGWRLGCMESIWNIRCECRGASRLLLSISQIEFGSSSTGTEESLQSNIKKIFLEFLRLVQVLESR